MHFSNFLIVAFAASGLAAPVAPSYSSLTTGRFEAKGSFDDLIAVYTPKDGGAHVQGPSLEKRGKYGTVRWSGPGTTFMAEINGNLGKNIKNGSHRPKFNVVSQKGKIRCLVGSRDSRGKEWVYIMQGTMRIDSGNGLEKATRFNCIEWNK